MSSGGEDWKALRKRFNPGFAPQHLMTLLPSIVETATIFINHLDSFARNMEEFSLQSLATNLTFDVIGKLVLDNDMGAQRSRPSEFMRVFHELIQTFTSEQIDLPWWCTPRLEWKRSCLAKQVRSTLETIIRDAYAERNEDTKPCSILSMSLQDVDDLSPDIMDVTCDQLSSFLFAGHDTTSTTIAWVIYELSRTPHALRAVRAELDEIFSPDSSPAAGASHLLVPGGEQLVHRMSYASAVIKEMLRLWPPGATARMTKPGDGLKITLRTSEDSSGTERWLQDDIADKIPAGAWRAFERDPCNCIGQELATIEARIVIELAARRYDFTKVGLGAVTLDNSTDKAGDV
ncbi:hypothetical protein VSDG_02932 [Cytospora chrysosperma]|uniref:Cytochrome P450 n=1 Tax=Cytospora chrysosperma TaxID=252740 RepID=A0A423W934_CYTCH|nr:hypothetical protein VSDG_02932 [Valsa sordida]